MTPTQLQDMVIGNLSRAEIRYILDNDDSIAEWHVGKLAEHFKLDLTTSQAEAIAFWVNCEVRGNQLFAEIIKH